MLKLWAPQCLAGFPCAHIRLQGTNVVATFPVAVGMASPHLQGPEPLYLCLLEIGARKLYSFGAQGSRLPLSLELLFQVWGQDQGQSRRPKGVCACLSCLVVPCLSGILSVCLWLACVWSP